MKLNLNGAACQTGYGIASINFCKALTKLGHEISFQPISGNINCDNREDQELMMRLSQVPFFYDAPSVKIWHQFFLGEHTGRGKYFAMPIFELDHFSDLEKHHLGFPDVLLVNSNWGKSVIEQNGIKSRCEVIPLGYDPEIFYSRPSTRNDKAYRFFNAGKIEIRKGIDVLLQVFNSAFSKKDNVELHMLVHNPFYTKEENEKWYRYYHNLLGDRVVFHEPRRTHQEVAELMSEMDCFIVPSRGEGWNLELLEMMAMGKPCIATDYSAHTEFFKAGPSTYPIQIDQLEDAYDGKWFFNQGRWAHLGEKQIEQTIEHMRTCYSIRPDGLDAIKLAESFTWEKSALKLVQVLQE